MNTEKTDENKKRLTEGLFAVAQAYLERGAYLQYDQLSPDRILRVTKRKRETLPPEAATPQHTLFSDCASFVWSVYYHAFGYEIESGVTWNMIDYGTPRVFYREMTHRETDEEVEALRDKLRTLLVPGDVIIYQYESGNGHAMLYMDEARYINCTQYGTFAGYDYENGKSVPQETGGIRIEDTEALFYPDEDTLVRGRNYLFSEKVRRFAVLRPLERVKKLTAETEARIGPYQGLVSHVECDHPGARAAERNGTVTYTVIVRNTGEETVELRVSFEAPEGTDLITEGQCRPFLNPGEQIRVSFGVRINRSAEPLLKPPHIIINGLSIHAPRVHTSGEGDVRADAFPGDLRDRMAKLFLRIDSVEGDVLVRRTQIPGADGGVYGMFGGTGVITPETLRDNEIRASEIRLRDCMTGDIVVVSEDAGFRDVCAYVFDGETFCETGSGKTLTREAGEELIDSLFGSFCFILLRPSYHTR